MEVVAGTGDGDTLCRVVHLTGMAIAMSIAVSVGGDGNEICENGGDGCNFCPIVNYIFISSVTIFCKTSVNHKLQGSNNNRK